jgi:hypothetical protein
MVAGQDRFVDSSVVGMSDEHQLPSMGQSASRELICGIVSESGPNREPLACGYKKGHVGAHAWYSLPTFVNGEAQEVRALRARLAQSEWIVCAEAERMLGPTP